MNVESNLPPASEKLLNTIFCNCKKGCVKNCGCKKVGLFCSLVCTSCQGQSYYNNVESNTTNDDFYEETTEGSFFLEQSTEIQQEETEDEDIAVGSSIWRPLVGLIFL